MQPCFTVQFDDMFSWFFQCKGSYAPQAGHSWTQLSRTMFNNGPTRTENIEHVRTLQNIMKISQIPRFGLPYFESSFRQNAHELASGDIGMLIDCMWCSPDHLEVMFRDPLLRVTTEDPSNTDRPQFTAHVLISYITTRYLPSFSSNGAVDEWKQRGEKVISTAATHWVQHFGTTIFGEILFRLCCYGGISLYAIHDNVFDLLANKPTLCSTGFEEIADMLAKWKVKFWNRPELFTSSYVWQKLGVAETAEILFAFGGEAPERLVSSPIWKIGGFEEAQTRGHNTRKLMQMNSEEKNQLLPSEWRMYLPGEIWFLVVMYA